MEALSRSRLLFRIMDPDPSQLNSDWKFSSEGQLENPW